MTKKSTKTPNQKTLATMTVAEFERANKTELQTKNKEMKLTEYFNKKGFQDFSRLIAV